ncbi:MAG: hypothetical protein QM791_15775 [Ferruginibacter sp.]
MSQEFQSFNTVEKESPEEKINALLDIGDSIEFGYYKAGVLPQVVQSLINSLPKEKNLKVRRFIFRDISAAYTKKADLSHVEFEPVLNILPEAEPFFICNVLNLLSLTQNQVYTPVISRYLSHPDREVRKEALSALMHLS